MSISKKFKAISNIIEQKKAQYSLDTQSAKIFVSPSGNISKYEFLIDKDVLPKKDLLEKAVAIKRFEYFLLVKELKKKTSVAEKHYQNLILIKRKKTKQKAKNVTPSQIYSATIILVFTNIATLMILWLNVILIQS